jgi:nucleoside-diphosphate-sugar epimerase
VGTAVIERLIGEGDEVRVIEADRKLAERWKSLGAYVALGASDDPDLIERAARSCRTMVVFDLDDAGVPRLETALEAVAPTTVDRVVAVATAGTRCLELLRSQAMDYVFLRASRSRLPWSRASTTPSAIAEAIDAADDLAGAPRMELDLSDRGAADALGLRPS